MKSNKDTVSSVASPARQRQHGAPPKNMIRGKRNEPSSPESNSENISPALRRRRLERKVDVEEDKNLKIASVAKSPKGRAGLRNSRPKTITTPNTSFNIEDNSLNKDIEIGLTNISATYTRDELSDALHANIVTPDTSFVGQMIETDEQTTPVLQNRKLRSGRQLKQSLFSTPEIDLKAENSEINSLNEQKMKKIESTNISSSESLYDNKTTSAMKVIEDEVKSPIHNISKMSTEMSKDNVEIISESPNTITKSDKTYSSPFENVVEPKTETIDNATESHNLEKAFNNDKIESKKDMGPMDSSIPIMSVMSPSAVSIDSAKGSSIGNDSDSKIFLTGDLYWGRIHNFCYWPAMVCPDESADDHELTRVIDHQTEVHVRFFSDNARHSWVKRDNLMPYQGVDSYRQLCSEVKEKYGEKSAKYQAFLPKKTKLKVWLSAAAEADVLAITPYAERMTKFFELNNAARIRNKEEKERRKSISVSKLGNHSSFFNSSESSDTAEHVTRKRNRSESPVSPAFSPIRTAKRRKTTADATELMQSKEYDDEKNKTPQTHKVILNTQIHSQTPTSALKTEWFQSPLFKVFHNIMREFVIEGISTGLNDVIEANLHKAVKNIWALRTVLREQVTRSLSPAKVLETTPKMDSINSTKRLSLRLKDLEQRDRLQTTESPKAPLTSAVVSAGIENRRLSSGSKRKRSLNRPIEEVIDDIFNLDDRYLFDNMGRDPVCKYCIKPGGVLKRCSKNCLSWFHTDCVANGIKGKSENGTLKLKPKPINKRRSTKFKNSENIIETVTETITPAPILVETTNSHAIEHITADDSMEKVRPKSNIQDIKKDLNTVDTLEMVEEPIVCLECAKDEKPKCFVCHNNKNETTTPTNGKTINEELILCNMPHCARFYHLSCLKYWPQTKTTSTKNSISSLRCPSHVCHTCVSDDPKGKFQNLNSANTTKCVKCPATYHMDSTCIPAGSQILTAAHIICPRHSISKTDQNVNVSWCFICVRGGKLICCETCPTAVHEECTNITQDSNESYICDECESGRMPLYGEMVWAKFNAYRWWPAIILPPTEVPINIRNKPHNPFEFVIRFFGTHDHGWISRRRVYLYIEGDWSELPKSKRPIDQSYLRGVKEAKEAYEIVKAKNVIRNGKNENKERLHPQPYVKIRVNRAVSPVKLHTDLEKVGKCDCRPEDEHPCGLDSNCLNRVLYHECNSKICPAGDRCENQMFESRVSPALEIFYAKKERGFGLRCRELIRMGTFIIEYVGEVINGIEFQRRMAQKTADRDENYYFLHVEKDYIIDAGPKGNMARFMNHSCDPNCETQKWSVNGLNRVGLFAIKDIPPNTELTFNYHWDELLGNDKKSCCCGSEYCTGKIGKSKDLKSKQQNSDENVARPSTKLAKQRKSMNIKIFPQKRIKNNSQVNKRKKKVIRSKRSASISVTETTDIKSTTSNDNNNNI